MFNGRSQRQFGPAPLRLSSLDHIERVCPEGHICCLIPSCSVSGPSEFQAHQRSTRESPKIPDEVISGHVFRHLDRLGAGITSFFSYVFMRTCSYAHRFLKWKETRGGVLSSGCSLLGLPWTCCISPGNVWSLVPLYLAQEEAAASLLWLAWIFFALNLVLYHQWFLLIRYF